MKRPPNSRQSNHRANTPTTSPAMPGARGARVKKAESPTPIKIAATPISFQFQNRFVLDLRG